MASIGDVDRNVTITFIGRDNASRAMTGIGNSASKTSRIVGGLVKVLKYAALAAATALAAGAVLVAKGLWDATKAAYDDDIAMKKLALTQTKAQDATKKQTEATSDYIDKMELATGIADDEMRPALAALALTGMSVQKSQDLLSVAMDVSTAKGKPLLSVAEALAKAHNGQTTGLQRLGIKTTDAAGESLEFSEILKKLKDRTEGAAKAAGKTDPLKRMGAAFQQIKEEVGKQFLPILRKFTNWIIDTAVPWIKQRFIPALKGFTDWIKNEAVPYIQDKILPAAKDFADRFRDDLWPAIKKVWDQAKKLVQSVLDLIGGFDETEKKQEGWVGAFDQIGDSIEELNEVLGPTLSIFQGIVDAMQWIEDHTGILSAIADAANPAAVIGNIKEDYDSVVGNNADGGWLKRAMGGWTMVGEHGPELINNRGYVKPHSASMGGAGGGNVYVTVQGAIDPVGTARQIRQILAKGDRASGRGALGLA